MHFDILVRNIFTSKRLFVSSENIDIMSKSVRTKPKSGHHQTIVLLVYYLEFAVEKTVER